MTADEFNQAADELKSRGIISPGHGWKTALSRKLGVTTRTIENYEKQGTTQRQTDYAIAALLNNIDPYGRAHSD